MTSAWRRGRITARAAVIMAAVVVALGVFPISPAGAAPPPPNDDFDHATVITATPFTDTVDTTGATVAADDPATCTAPGSTVWYLLTPAVNETVTASVAGSSYFASVSAFTGARGALTQVACSNLFPMPARWPAAAGVTYHIMVSTQPPFANPGNLVLTVTAASPPANDDFDHATVIAAVPFSTTEDTSGATAAPDDPVGCGGSTGSVWFSFTPSVNEVITADITGSSYVPTVSAYTGGRGALTPVGCGTGPFAVHWPVSAGVTYHIMVAGGPPFAGGGTLVLRVTGAFPPPNDDFDHATAITAVPFTATEDTTAATSAPDDPAACGGTQNSVWYTITPSVTETLIANTNGSNYQAVVSVYTGSRGSLTQVACPSGLLGATKWAATAGVTYHVMVANPFPFPNPTGNEQLTLNLSGAIPPPNDDFDHATIVSRLPFTDSLDVTGATQAPDDPTSCGPQDSSVWYQLTPPVNEQIVVDTTGSTYAPVVSMYTGPRGALTRVGCGPPVVGTTFFPATAGVTYHIMVANSAFFGAAGRLALTVTGVQAPVISKTFGASSIPLNGSTSLTFALNNPNASSAVTGVGFGDLLPAGMVVATPNGVSGSCGGGVVQAPAGSPFVALGGATLAAGANCTFSLQVTGTLAGVDTNSVTVNSLNAGTGNTSTATVTVIAPPVLAKSFGAASIPFGGTTALRFNLANPNPTMPLNGVGFSDTLPSGLVVSTPNGLTGGCGGGSITAAAGSGTVSVANATVPAGGNCSFSVDVTATSVGTDNNTTSPVTSTNAGTGPPATATLTVVKAATTTTVTASPASAALGVPVTFTGSVGPSGPNGAGTDPTGTVSFFLDGQASPVATVPLTSTTARFTASGLGAGHHTVTAAYGGDGNFLPSTSSGQTTVTCTRTLSGNQAALVLGPGSTCVLNGRVAGSVVVPKGSALDLEGATVSGSIITGAASFVRICGTSAAAVIVAGTTGTVLVPHQATFARNEIARSSSLSVCRLRHAM